MVEVSEDCVNFKVGDKVKVKTDLICEEYYEDLYFSPAMESFRGKVSEVVGYKDSGKYRLELSDIYVFNDAMLDAVEGTKSKFKVGDRVRVKSDLDSETYNDNLLSVTHRMINAEGKVFSISEVDEDGDYLLEGMSDYDYFNDDMLELVGESTLKVPQDAPESLTGLVRRIRELINYELLKVEFYSSEIDFTMFDSEAIVAYSKANDRIFFDSSNSGLSVVQILKIKEVMELLDANKDVLKELLTK